MAPNVNANIAEEGDTVTIELEDGRRVVIEHRGDHVRFAPDSREAEALRRIEPWLLAVSMGADAQSTHELAELVGVLRQLAPPATE